MNQIIQKLMGMAALTNQVIATDTLLASKTAVRNYALAITETATPEIRETLVRHLDDAIQFHKQISTYMIENEFYHPHNTSKQLEIDLNIAEKALSLTGEIYPRRE